MHTFMSSRLAFGIEKSEEKFRWDQLNRSEMCHVRSSRVSGIAKD